MGALYERVTLVYAFSFFVNFDGFDAVEEEEFVDGDGDLVGWFVWCLEAPTISLVGCFLFPCGSLAFSFR